MENEEVKKETFSDKVKTFQVGPVPLPVYLVLAAIILFTAYLEQLPVSMIGGFAVILSLGWLLGTIG